MLAAVAAGAIYVTQPLLARSPRQGAIPAVDPRRLEAHVRMLAVTLAPRDYTHPASLDRVAAYVRGELESAGARAGEQPYTTMGRGYRNVIGSFGPEGGERIVVGAHYDTFDPLPGADDNASGVAGLIELAGLLGTTKDLAMRVDLVVYTLEEPPVFRTEWMGSWVHAALLRREGVRLRAMISLEMIGYFSDAPGTQSFPVFFLRPFYPSTANFIAVVGKFGQGGLVRQVKAAMGGTTDLAVYSMTSPAWLPGVDFSDHWSYWSHGYPALMITDTAFYRNQRYHTARDTPDTLDYVRMAKVVQGVHQAVLALAR